MHIYTCRLYLESVPLRRELPKIWWKLNFLLVVLHLVIERIYLKPASDSVHFKQFPFYYPCLSSDVGHQSRHDKRCYIFRSQVWVSWQYGKTYFSKLFLHKAQEGTGTKPRPLTQQCSRSGGPRMLIVHHPRRNTVEANMEEGHVPAQVLRDGLVWGVFCASYWDFWSILLE